MSSLNDPSLGLGGSEIRQLYFAYGSNMHLQQMAARCPDSSVFAIGILHNYKWQTNTRGGGNVVRGGPEDHVEGVAFLVSTRDVEILRRHEGVEQENFVERILDIETRPILDRNLDGQSTAACRDMLARENSVPGSAVPGAPAIAARQDEEQTSVHFALEDEEESEKVVLKALVYISYKYQLPGPIREEYVGRMHMAIKDACRLGVSNKFVENSLYPHMQ